MISDSAPVLKSLIAGFVVKKVPVVVVNVDLVLSV